MHTAPQLPSPTGSETVPTVWWGVGGPLFCKDKLFGVYRVNAGAQDSMLPSLTFRKCCTDIGRQ